MFRPEPMTRISLIARRKDKDSVLEHLQCLGTIHLESYDKTEDHETPSELIHDALEYLEKIRQVEEIIESNGLAARIASIGSKEKDAKMLPSTSKRYIDSLSRKADNIRSHMASYPSERRKLQEKIDTLYHFRYSDILLSDLSDGKSINRGLGTIKPEDLPKIEKMCDISISDRKENICYIIYVCEKKHGEKINRYIEPIETETQGSIQGEINHLASQLDDLEKLHKTLDASRKELIKEKGRLCKEKTYWSDIKRRLSKEKLLGRTEKTFIATGWIPDRNLDEVMNMENIVAFKEKPDKEPPIKLDNPSIVKPFEMITSLFGLPRYGNIDPTVFIAIGFPIFFGIMLTDMAYGLLLLIFSSILYAVSKDSTKKTISHILIISSLSTVLFGALFGSFFGELLGFRSFFDALRDPITITIYALLLGLLHINFGLVLDIVRRIETKAGRLREPLVWVALEAGIAIWYLAQNTIISNIGIAMIILSVIERASKGISGILSITTFFGSWLSYIRLMALAVATAWLAYVINMGASAAAEVSLLLGAIVFMVGHLFNMSLNIVSSFVHSMRLHYVEFFQRFYEAGGREYSPLRKEDDVGSH